MTIMQIQERPGALYCFESRFCLHALPQSCISNFLVKECRTPILFGSCVPLGTRDGSEVLAGAARTNKYCRVHKKRLFICSEQQEEEMCVAVIL